MLLASALLWVPLAFQQATPPQSGYLTVEGKAVPLRLVSSTPPTPPEGFLQWKGLEYLGGSPAKLFEPYKSVFDWKPVADQFEPVKDKQGAIWKEKIVIFTRTEHDSKDARGVTQWNRDNIFATRTQEISEAIARVKAWFKATTNGQLDLAPDVQVEWDIVRDPTAEALPYGEEFARWYFGPRINGGGYEAEDKVFRGPYNGAVYVLPGYTPGMKISPTVINGTPVTAVAFGEGQDWQFNPGHIELALFEAIRDQIDARLKLQGYREVQTTTGPGADPSGWLTAADLQEPSAEQVVARLKNPVSVTLPITELRFPLAQIWVAQGTDVQFATDDQHGQVLKVTEKRTFRQGGFGLPMKQDGSALAAISDKPTLSLFARTTSRNPISVRVQGENGQAFWISLGRNPVLAESSGRVIGSAPFDANGQWQKIAVDLRPLAEAAGVKQVIALAIEPSPDALLADLDEFGAGEYFFDQINLSSEAAQPLLGDIAEGAAASEAQGRALFAAHASASSPELLALLGDSNSIVRLNAALAYQRIKDPAAEAQLGHLGSDINPAIEEAALRALAFQGTDSARTLIRNTLRFNPDEHAKSIAARMLAQTGDPKYAGDVLLLFTTTGWQPKIAAIQAMTNIPKIDPKFRLGFLRNDDPGVRLEVVRTAELANRETLSALQWHAVNDPSDLVRASAYEQLIASNDPASVEQGYAGVKDDSKLVRLLVLGYLADHPAAANRKSLQLAMADRSPAVRTAALRAYASFPGEVPLEELANVLNDDHPDVQLALIAVSKAKSLKLPVATTDKMKASPDPRVAAAIGT